MRGGATGCRRCQPIAFRRHSPPVALGDHPPPPCARLRQARLRRRPDSRYRASCSRHAKSSAINHLRGSLNLPHPLPAGSETTTRRLGTLAAERANGGLATAVGFVKPRLATPPASFHFAYHLVRLPKGPAFGSHRVHFHDACLGTLAAVGTSYRHRRRATRHLVHCLPSVATLERSPKVRADSRCADPPFCKPTSG